MEIKEISYHDRLPKNMVSKFNYFVKDFLKEYSDQLDRLDFNEYLDINKEYEADLEVYFVKFSFYKKKAFIEFNSIKSLFTSIKLASLFYFFCFFDMFFQHFSIF